MSTSAFTARFAAFALSLAGLVVLADPAMAGMVKVAREQEATGVLLRSQTRSGVELAYVMDRFGLEPIKIDGSVMQEVVLPGALLPNEPGAPNLPSVGRTMAIPRGAEVVLTVTAAEKRTYRDIDVAPAAPIQFEDDDTPPTYVKNMSIYGKRAAYPASPVAVSGRWKIRGIDVVTLGVTPFQYNPGSRELTVYTRIEFRVDLVGGTGEYGDQRLRNRYWEPLLRDHLINYSALPPVDFTETGGQRSGYEYVIICPDDASFVAWADSLKSWRKLQGISTEVFTLTEVGGTTTTAIENFLNNAYSTWETPPSAFLLLGDYPSSGDGGEEGDRGTTITSPIWNGYCVSDNIYADVDGDNLPDMAHARICARNASELQRMIGRMFDYERHPVTDPEFYAHPIIAGGWQTERWFILCTEVCYGHQVNVLGKEPVREYAIYSGVPSTSWSSNQNTYLVVNYFGPNGLGYIPATPQHLTDWDGSAARIITDLNAGAYMLLHRDHGLETGWGEPAFYNSHLSQLTYTKYPFVFSINCLTGKYNWGSECFTERFHRQEHGALGLIAASEVSYSFVNDVFIWGMWDAMWPEFDPSYGDADDIGPTDLMPAFAMASGKHYLQASSFPYNPQHKVYTHHLFHHHGDAFIRMNTEVPRHLDVVHDDHLEFGAQSFTVQADAGAVIALTVNGEIIGVADATGGADAIPIVPQSTEGQLRITVTKANAYRYDVSVPIERGSLLVYADGSGDYPTIQAAIEASIEGNLILLADGVFTGEGNRDLDVRGKPITIESQSGNAAACIIDCEGSELEPHRGFLFHTTEGPSTILRNITIRNGWALGAGGAIACTGASPMVTGCSFFDNNATMRGGAIDCENSQLAMAYCEFAGNTSGSGGAIALALSAVTVSNCTFYGNAGAAGGCVYLESGQGTFERDIFSFSTEGAAFACGAPEAPVLSCCDVYGNAGGDWVGCIASLLGTSGNFASDPAFCSPIDRDFALWNFSPCQQAVCGQIGAKGIECYEASAVRDEPRADGQFLGRAMPNPFGQTTSIAFEIPSEAAGVPAALEIYDATGRRLQTLQVSRTAGRHVVSWDGTGADGQRVAAGVYYYQLRVGDRSETRRVIVLR